MFVPTGVWPGPCLLREEFTDFVLHSSVPVWPVRAPWDSHRGVQCQWVLWLTGHNHSLCSHPQWLQWWRPWYPHRRLAPSPVQSLTGALYCTLQLWVGSVHTIITCLIQTYAWSLCLPLATLTQVHQDTHGPSVRPTWLTVGQCLIRLTFMFDWSFFQDSMTVVPHRLGWKWVPSSSLLDSMWHWHVAHGPVI